MNKLKDYTTLISKALKNEGKNHPFLVILIRLLIWILKYKGGISSFLMLKLNKKGNSFNEIISGKEFNEIHDQLNPGYYRSILEDKYVFDRFMKSFNFPIAEMIGLIMYDSVFWINENRTEPMENIMNYELSCYCKMHTKWGGKDVHKLEIHNSSLIIDNELSNIHNFKKMVSGAIFVLQKTVIQHPDLNRMNSSCVNTVRAITIHDGTNANNFLNYLRIGIGDSIVDNVSHGGLGCGINIDGTLFKTANDKNGLNTWITHHPNSNIELNGFKIPFYKDALELVIRMHQCFHCFFIIGWDIAITESGPVIIEANPVSDLVYEQSLYGGLRHQFLKYSNSYKTKRGIK